MEQYSQKRILIIFTGGTIAGNVAASKVSQDVKSSPDDFMSELNRSIEIIKKNWNIEINPEIVELYNKDSSNVMPENWTMIIDKIVENYDSFDSFLVLHGTNTMGYTTAAVSFAFENINKPVVFTGAQVPLGFLGSDATTNLVNALRLCVWGYHPIKGVLAVFGSKIITGTRVKKGTDFDYDPFNAFQTGSLGQIGRYIRLDENALNKHVAYLSKFHPLAIQSRVLSVKNKFDTSKISSLTEFPGMDTNIFKTLVENNGTKAFIFRAFGAGDPNTIHYPSFEYLKEKQIPIIVTTQAANGVASFQVNESGKYLLDNDLAIPAYDMSMECMVTKMGWLLAQNMDYFQIKQMMLTDLHGEVRVENELI